jgi:hypothetical protein
MRSRRAARRSYSRRRGQVAGQSLFTGDTHFVVYMDGEGSEPTRKLYVDWTETRPSHP